MAAPGTAIFPLDWIEVRTKDERKKAIKWKEDETGWEEKEAKEEEELQRKRKRGKYELQNDDEDYKPSRSKTRRASRSRKVLKNKARQTDKPVSVCVPEAKLKREEKKESNGSALLLPTCVSTRNFVRKAKLLLTPSPLLPLPILAPTAAPLPTPPSAPELTGSIAPPGKSRSPDMAAWNDLDILAATQLAMIARISTSSKLSSAPCSGVSRKAENPGVTSSVVEVHQEPTSMARHPEATFPTFVWSERIVSKAVGVGTMTVSKPLVHPYSVHQPAVVASRRAETPWSSTPATSHTSS